MLPLLRLFEDGQEHTVREVTEKLAVQYKLTDDELKKRVPSGRKTVFDDRVGWAKTYIKQAGLLNSSKRAIFTISDRGRKVLSQNLSRIDNAYLERFPEFIAFKNRKRKRTEESVRFRNEKNDSNQTPLEILDQAYQEIRSALASDLLDRVLELSPVFFERLVVELLVKMGYGGSIKDAGQAIGKTGDEGIDGTIKEDMLGLDAVYIQAKRWGRGNVVGRPELQKFVGALAGQGAKKGIFITTSSFTKEAKEYAPKNDTKIVLIDGEELAEYMIDYNLGCTPQQIYEVKKIDNDYFVDN